MRRPPKLKIETAAPPPIRNYNDYATEDYERVRRSSRPQAKSTGARTVGARPSPSPPPLLRRVVAPRYPRTESPQSRYYPEVAHCRRTRSIIVGRDSPTSPQADSPTSPKYAESKRHEWYSRPVESRTSMRSRERYRIADVGHSRKGFIADDSEGYSEVEESDSGLDERRKKRTMKKRVVTLGEETALDREELDLIWEKYGNKPSDVASVIYAFIPSRATSSSDDSLQTPASDTLQLDTTSAALREHLNGASQIRVFGSRYTGDREINGHHAVELTAAPVERTQHQPLFRWIHFTQQSMDFDEFTNQISRIKGLNSDERQALDDMILTIRRDGIKPIQTANGSYVRHMDPKFIQISITPDESIKEQTVAERTVSWVCLPYFSLEKYSGLRAAKDNPNSFPIQTLLQAQFSRATRERDMQQAVRQLQVAPPGLCFHIAHLWCLVLDNSLLLTCSRLSKEALCGDAITIIHNVQDPPGTRPKSNILVRYMADVMWSIPAEDCPTWLKFIGHFHEFWPKPLKFYRYKKPVTADDWSKIHHLAANSNMNVILELQVGSPVIPNFTSSGVLSPIGTGKDGPSVEPPVKVMAQAEAEDTDVKRPVKTATHPDRRPAKRVHFSAPARQRSIDDSKPPPSFPIFSCLDGVANSTTGGINKTVLEEHLAEVDEYLLQNCLPTDRRAYSSCRQASRGEVYQLLEEEGRPLADPEQPPWPQLRRDRYKTRVDFFNTADMIFKFFFPVDVVVPTVGKFWGAVKTIVMNTKPEEPDPDDSEGRDINERVHRHTVLIMDRRRLTMLALLEYQARNIPAFNEWFASAQPSDLTNIRTPGTLINGWMHILLGLVVLPVDEYRPEKLMAAAYLSCRAGLEEMIDSLSKTPLIDKSVVLPMELLSLISMKLLRDITPGLPNISDTYSSCLDTIESDITTKSSDRSHEYRLGRLKQEISIIQWTTSWQTTIVNAMGEAGRPSRSNRHAPQYHTGKSAPSALFEPATANNETAPDPKIQQHGYRQLILYDIWSYLQGREREFVELRSHASQLEEFNRNKVDSTRDRQERAIYAFTIVTIIFLPLSSIASIFGMNSSDVRDMELGQWAYWATAVPVTFAVIFVGLFWTGELGNIVSWLAQKALSARERALYGGGDPRGYEVIGEEMVAEVTTRGLRRRRVMV
ncbi:hypothetical protein QBC35DRAFT_417078 [Podospora australis]|uniref:Spt6 acidic N-terminal domain-containing protein n=1 Tax=Podospora australis TaxID=1536484 RepID=A0AAN7AF67_9PEZI|nr:hypothetical protein QBC35DRAFT_417078 [Podospora australis]